ncbi:MAG: gas vesicle protein [Chloroflexales bacterium]
MIRLDRKGYFMGLSITEIATKAKEQLTLLTGLKASTVSSLFHDEEGWHIVADMIELKRIPESADVLATYEVTLDERGNLQSYQRTRRYTRGEVSN